MWRPVADDAAHLRQHRRGLGRAGQRGVFTAVDTPYLGKLLISSFKGCSGRPSPCTIQSPFPLLSSPCGLSETWTIAVSEDSREEITSSLIDGGMGRDVFFDFFFKGAVATSSVASSFTSGSGEGSRERVRRDLRGGMF